MAEQETGQEQTGFYSLAKTKNKKGKIKGTAKKFSCIVCCIAVIAMFFVACNGPCDP